MSNEAISLFGFHWVSGAASPLSIRNGQWDQGACKKKISSKPCCTAPQPPITTMGAGKEKVDRSVDQTSRRPHVLVFECDNIRNMESARHKIGKAAWYHQKAGVLAWERDLTRGVHGEEFDDNGEWPKKRMMKGPDIGHHWRWMQKTRPLRDLKLKLKLARTQTLHDYKCIEQFPVIWLKVWYNILLTNLKTVSRNNVYSAEEFKMCWKKIL